MDEDDDDFFEAVLRAQKRASQVAFETAVRTGTALVFYEDGKVVEVKPKFKYILVPIEDEKVKGEKNTTLD